MHLTAIGKSDIKVSSVGVGCWQFNGGEQSRDQTWPAQSEQVSKDIVDKAFELGVNYFDTATGYLNSETVLGRLLQGRRKDIVLASKFGTTVKNYTAVDIEKDLTQSLQRLQTDYIDLYQVHWPSFLTDYKECFDELKRQQAKGRIREYGVCNFGPGNLEEALSVGAQPISNQVSYNLLWRAAEEKIFPVCKENGISVLAYSPLQQGLLSGKYTTLEDVPIGRRRTRLFSSSSCSLSKHQGDGAEKQLFQAIHDIKAMCDKNGIAMPTAALSWCLESEPVHAVIVGASSPEQLEKNAKLVKLQHETVEKLNELTNDLKEHFIENTDPWAKQSRMK